MNHPLDRDDYDWREAFGYAGKHADETYASYQGVPDFRRAHPQDTETSREPFGQEDVVKVIAYAEGENDGADWLCAGKLNDGRWFLLSAGCDYTGWDCQAGGTVTIAPDRETLLAFGVTSEQRQRLGLYA